MGASPEVTGAPGLLCCVQRTRGADCAVCRGFEVLSVLVGGGLCHRWNISGLVVHPVSSSWRSGQGGRVGWASSWERGPAGRRAWGARSPWCQGARAPGQDPAGLWLHRIEPSRQGTASPRPEVGVEGEEPHVEEAGVGGVGDPGGGRRPGGGGRRRDPEGGRRRDVADSSRLHRLGRLPNTRGEEMLRMIRPEGSAGPTGEGVQKIRGRRGRRLTSGG